MSALDRDAAREVLREYPEMRGWTEARMHRLLVTLEACVRPAPPQGIDRNDVLAAIDRVCRDDLSDYYGEVRQRMHEAVLALLRPVEA